MPFGTLSRVDPGNHALVADADKILPQEAALSGECMAHCKAWGLSKRVSCAKTVGPILAICMTCFYAEVSFGDRDKAAHHLRGIIPKNLQLWGVNKPNSLNINTCTLSKLLQ